jgi:hypothetical protein
MHRSVFLLLMVFAPRIGQAQTPDDRVVLARWDSTLRAVSDAGLVAALTRPPVVDRDVAIIADVLRNARLASLAKPLGYGRDGAQAVELIRRNHRDWPWAHFAAWRIEDANLSETGTVSTAWTEAMRLHRRPAVRALLDAVLADSSFVPAHRELIRLAPYPLLWATPDAELRLARFVSNAGVSDPEVIARHAMLELELGSLDSIAALIDRLGGALPSPARAERIAAQLAFARGDRDAGLMHYHRGIASILGLDDFDEFAADAEWIADSSESTQLDSLPISEAAAWFEAFWTRRDLLAARLPGERLAEHFRRYRIALQEYRDGTGDNLLIGWRSAALDDEAYDLRPSLQALQGVPGDAPPGLKPLSMYSDQMLALGPTQPSIRILDDRGITFLRHGPPDKRVQYRSMLVNSRMFALNYESWAYASDTRPMIIHFGQLTPANPGQWIRPMPGGNDMMTPCGVDAGYCTLSNARWDRLEQRGLRHIATALTTDSDPFRFAKSLDIVVQSYGIPGRGILAVIAIPADRLVPKGSVRDTLSRYAAHLRIVVGDSASGRIVGSLDTVRTWRVARKLGAGEWLSTWLEIDAPPGNWDVAVVADDTASTVGGGTRITGVPVADFDGKTLRIGDPILGRGNSGLRWQRAGEPVPLNPTGTWRLDEPATLFYEVDGMVAGHDYETRIEVWQEKSPERGAKTVLTFREVALGGTQRIRRDLSLAEIGTGEFRLVIRIRDTVSRADASRSRRLVVK